MYKKNEYNIESTCPVCGNIIFVDSVGNGEKCLNCGWNHSRLHEEFPDRVMCPNLISLNKAKQLYKEKKTFIPDLSEFLDMLYFYGEVEFWYKGLNCCLSLRNSANKKIEFGWDSNNVYYFSDKEDFIQNAKIGNEYVRDIWNKVENAKYV